MCEAEPGKAILGADVPRPTKLTSVQLEALVRERAPSIAAGFRAAAQNADKEVDLVAEAEKVIGRFAESFGLALDVSRERTLITGFADAVYNRFVIEYEPPASLKASNSSSRNKHAVQQVKDYIEGVSVRDRHAKDRLAGVALDGYYYIFVRFRDGKWSVDDPAPVGDHSTRTFLRYLVSLSTELALTPENLVRDFGAGSHASETLVSQLYRSLCSSKSKKVDVLFRQWLRQFQEVSGYDGSGQQLSAVALARMYGLADWTPDLEKLFFAVHSYYALFIKLLALQIAHFFLMPKMGTNLGAVADYDSPKLRSYLTDLETGGLFAQLGIRNFLEGDFFTWYLESWSDELTHAVREMVGHLARFSLVTLDVDPEETRDLLKQLYQNLMPKQLRHALGEYYTPDWLARRLLVQLNYDGNPAKRILDPACGSGTFLVLALKQVRQFADEKLLAPDMVLESVLHNVVGFDLNPLAVVSARTNYLLALGDLIQHRHGDIDIPVYLADSIRTPSADTSLLGGDAFTVNTAVGEFRVPHSLVLRREVDKLTDALEECVRNRFSRRQFEDRFAQQFSVNTASEREVAADLFAKLADLEEQGIDGIWARILRNAFAPLFQEPFDFIAGNPPWVNWESLPADYRQESKDLWTRHNLFPHAGFETILGKGKKDISMLMTFVAADDYLRDGGKLGFVITQSLLKSSGAGQGFRRMVPASGTPLRVISVDDMVNLNPFEGASNRTAVIVLQKGTTTSYPVPYNQWSKRLPGRVPETASLEEVVASCRVRQHVAQPVDSGDTTSSWMSGRRRSLRAAAKVVGQSDYQARAGASTWMNGVYWLRIEEEVPGGVLVSNLPETGKATLDSVQVVLEPDLLYPLLRAGDVSRWHAQPVFSILMVQDPKKRRGYDEDWLKTQYPRTYAYLSRFRDVLASRSGYRRYYSASDPFYSMFNVAEYTFAPYKVVFPSIGTELACAVVSQDGGKFVIPQHIVTIVPLHDENEAHYVCACMNSAPARFTIEAYSQKGGKSFATPQALEHVGVPRYSPENSIHVDLARCSRRAHESVAADVDRDMKEIETSLDGLAAQLWGLTPPELKDLHLSLEENRESPGSV